MERAGGGKKEGGRGRLREEWRWVERGRERRRGGAGENRRGASEERGHKKGIMR